MDGTADSNMMLMARDVVFSFLATKLNSDVTGTISDVNLSSTAPGKA